MWFKHVGRGLSIEALCTDVQTLSVFRFHLANFATASLLSSAVFASRNYGPTTVCGGHLAYHRSRAGAQKYSLMDTSNFGQW